MKQNKTTLSIYSISAFVLFAVVFSISSAFAYAQEDASATTDSIRVKPSIIRPIQAQNKIDTKRNILQEKRDDLREKLDNKPLETKDAISNKRESLENRQAEIKEKLAERKTKLEEKAKERISKYVDRIIKRLNAALDRILKIADRIDSRILKLEERFVDRGLDLSEAKRLVEETRNEAVSAREDIASINSILDETLNAENPKESFSKVREVIKSAGVSVKNAHKALVEAIKSVKASVDALSLKPTDDVTNDTSDDN